MKKPLIGILAIIITLTVFVGNSSAMTNADIIAHEKALMEDMTKILKNQTVSSVGIWTPNFEDNNIISEAAVVVKGDFKPKENEIKRLQKAFEKELNQGMVLDRYVITQYETFIYFKPAN
jgi:hypothetical protein